MSSSVLVKLTSAHIMSTRAIKELTKSSDHLSDSSDMEPVFVMGVNDVYLCSPEVEIMRMSVTWLKPPTGLCDLTVSAAVFNSAGKYKDHVSFGRQTTTDKAIFKEKKLPKGEINEETLTINLARITDDHCFIFVALNIYTEKKTFNDVRDIRCRCFEMKRPPVEVARYDVGASSKVNGLVHSLVYRRPSDKQWFVLPMGMFGDGRTYKELIPLMEECAQKIILAKMAPTGLSKTGALGKVGGKMSLSTKASFEKSYGVGLTHDLTVHANLDTQSDTDADVFVSGGNKEGNRMVRKKVKSYSSGRSVMSAFVRNTEEDLQSSSSDEDALLSILPNHSAKTVVRYDSSCYNVGSRYPCLQEHVNKFRTSYSVAKAAEDAKKVLVAEASQEYNDTDQTMQSIDLPALMAPDPAFESEQRSGSRTDLGRLSKVSSGSAVDQFDADPEALKVRPSIRSFAGVAGVVLASLPVIKKKVQSNEDRLAALMAEMSAGKGGSSRDKKKAGARAGIKTNLSSMLASLL